jgi:hypothetical protein
MIRSLVASRHGHRRYRRTRLACAAVGLAAAAGLAAAFLPVPQAAASADAAAGSASVAPFRGLNGQQEANLLSVARQTWNFYQADIDPATNLPMDNITYAGGSATPTTFGAYTSAADIGVYLWAVVSARDLHVISTPEAVARIRATLEEVTTGRRRSATPTRQFRPPARSVTATWSSTSR